MRRGRENGCGARPGGGAPALVLIAGAIVGALATPGTAQAAPAAPATPARDGDPVAEIRAMHWQREPVIGLDASHSSFRPPQGFYTVTLQEAVRYQELVDASRDTAIEAVSIDPDTNQELLLSWRDTGYVTSDDWSDVDPDDFLKQMQAADAGANERRRAHGLPTLTTTGWLRRPTLDPATHTVSWIVEGVDSEGSRIANAVALKLGRHGFERIVWIAPPERVGSPPDLLQAAVRGHAFEDGRRYADHADGDRMAAVGVAGLVAAALGVKLVKFAWLGALLVFAKKGIALVLLPLIAFWRRIAGLFRRRESGR